MKNKFRVLLGSILSLALVSCGGGNQEQSQAGKSEVVSKDTQESQEASITNSEESSQEIDEFLGLEFRLEDDDTYTLIRAARSGTFNVPNLYNAKRVTGIGQGAISASVTKLSLDDNITRIAPGAFKNTYGLTEIEFDSNDVYELKNGCIVEKASNTVIAGFSFSTIPSDVAAIGNQAFAGQKRLAGELNIPESVTRIESEAFSGCEGLTSVNVPNTVTSIGQNAFAGCSNLEELHVPFFGDGTATNSATGYVFNYQIPTSLEKLYVSGTNGTLYTNSVPSDFRNMELHLGNQFTKFEKNAFYVGSGIMATRAKYNNVYFEGTVSEWSQIDFAEYNSCPNTTDSENCVMFKQDDGSYAPLDEEFVAPQGIETIKKYAFYGFAFSSITIGGHIKSIGDSAFAYAIPDFADIVIEQGVQSIGTQAFINHNGIDVSLPASMESIGGQAFNGANSARDVTYAVVRGTIDVTTSGYGAGSLKILIVPDGITTINPYTFGFVKGYIWIPKSVTKIEYGNCCFDMKATVLYEGTRDEYNNITITTTKIEDNNFIPEAVYVNQSYENVIQGEIILD